MTSEATLSTTCPGNLRFSVGIKTATIVCPGQCDRGRVPAIILVHFSDGDEHDYAEVNQQESANVFPHHHQSNTYYVQNRSKQRLDGPSQRLRSVSRTPDRNLRGLSVNSVNNPSEGSIRAPPNNQNQEKVWFLAIFPVLISYFLPINFDQSISRISITNVNFKWENHLTTVNLAVSSFSGKKFEKISHSSQQHKE